MAYGNIAKWNEIVEPDIIQNLKDAGCEEKAIDNFIQYYRSGEIKKGLKVLSLHRQRLLDEIHGGQRRIDCLDYLIYELNQAGQKRQSSNS